MAGQQLQSTVYLVLKPTYTTWSPKSVNGFTVESVRKKRPQGRAAAGSVILQVKLKLPLAAFTPLAPEVEITVPEGAYDIVPIVEVVVPEEPEPEEVDD